MSYEDIRQRLAAIAGADWTALTHQRDREHHGDWWVVGPITMQVHEDDLAERAVVSFLKHAAADIERLLSDLDHHGQAENAQQSAMPNPIYGRSPKGEPARLLADAVEVLRPNGTTVTMDLKALADVAIGAERALAGLGEEVRQLRRRGAALEEKVRRQERAGRMLAGDPFDPED